MSGWNNNFAAVTLDIDYGDGNNYFTKKYSCLDVQAGESQAKASPNTLPIANFENVDRFIDFMVSRLTPRVQQIQGPGGLPKYYVCYWPINNVTPEYYESNKDKQFKKLLVTFAEAYLSAESLGLPLLDGTYPKGVSAVSPLVSATIGLTPTVTPTHTLTPTPTRGTVPPPTPTPSSCEKPVIISFTPTFGGPNTILTITGKYLQSTSGVTINNVKVINGIIKSSDGTKLTVTVPQSPSAGIQKNLIIVEDQYGSATSTNKFTYNSAITNTNAPAAQLNTTNVSQQTQTELSEIQSVNRQDGQTGPKVLIDTIVTNSIKGFESLLVKVNTVPTLGVWVINQNVNIKVELKDTVNTGNNTLKPNTIKEINFISENGFVSNNSVYITSSQITELIVESNNITDEEWKQTKEILGSVNLTTVPADKNKQPLWSTYNFKMFKS
jgi:hypothetical protein